jgi:hypothetical protein
MSYNRHFGSKQSVFGEDTKGHDVKAYGDTTGKYVQWDASDDALNVYGKLNQVYQHIVPMESASSATNMVNYGVSTITSTSGGGAVFPLAAPVAGVKKTIIRLEGAATARTIYIKASTSGITFDGTNNICVMTLAGSLNLVGVSATRWYVESVYPSTTATSFANST